MRRSSRRSGIPTTEDERRRVAQRPSFCTMLGWQGNSLYGQTVGIVLVKAAKMRYTDENKTKRTGASAYGKAVCEDAEKRQGEGASPLRGHRAGGGDKMFSQLCGVPVLARTLTALDRAVLVDEIVVAVQPEKLEEVAALVSRTGIRKPIRVVEGGANRAESVLLAALEAREDTEYLAIHDGARPLILPEQVDEMIRLGQKTYAAAPALPVTDTVKVADMQGLVQSTPDRKTLLRQKTQRENQADGVPDFLPEVTLSCCLCSLLLPKWMTGLVVLPLYQTVLLCLPAVRLRENHK